MKKLVLLLLLIACSQLPESGQPIRAPVEPVPEPIVAPPVAEPVIVLPVVEPAVPEDFCIDSDGSNVFVKGEVKSDKDIVSDSCLSVKKNGLVSISKVLEYTCSGSKIVADVVNCEYGCDSGACLQVKNKAALVENGVCLPKSVSGITITNCFTGCVPDTMCAPAPLKTKGFSLPYQLSCLARTGDWAVGKWFEFDVTAPMDVLLFADVEGSEVVAVDVRNAQGVVATLINQKLISNNRCFGKGSGFAKAKLAPGSYEVRIGAKAAGTSEDYLRSFRGVGFSVGFLS